MVSPGSCSSHTAYILTAPSPLYFHSRGKGGGKQRFAGVRQVDLFSGPMGPDHRLFQRVDTSRTGGVQPGAAGVQSFACARGWGVRGGAGSGRGKECLETFPEAALLGSVKECQEGGKGVGAKEEGGRGKGFICSQPPEVPRDALRCAVSAGAPASTDFTHACLAQRF